MEVNKIKFIHLFIIIFLTLFSCKEKKDISQNQNVKCEIVGFTLNYVAEKRDWCRFSNIILDISIINTSQESLKLELNSLKDLCDFEKVGNLELRLNEQNINAILLGEGGNKLNINEKVILQFRIQKQHLAENDTLYYKFPNMLSHLKSNILGNLKINNVQSCKLKISDQLNSKFILDDTVIKEFNEFINLYKIKTDKRLKYVSPQ